MQFDKAKLAAYYKDAPDDISLDTLDLSRIPAHVSLIMDGNGRWAKAQGLERTKGHRAGVTSLREAVTTAVRLGRSFRICVFNGKLAALTKRS